MRRRYFKRDRSPWTQFRGEQDFNWSWRTKSRRPTPAVGRARATRSIPEPDAPSTNASPASPSAWLAPPAPRWRSPVGAACASSRLASTSPGRPRGPRRWRSSPCRRRRCCGSRISASSAGATPTRYRLASGQRLLCRRADHASRWAPDRALAILDPLSRAYDADMAERLVDHAAFVADEWERSKAVEALAKSKRRLSLATELANINVWEMTTATANCRATPPSRPTVDRPPTRSSRPTPGTESIRTMSSGRRRCGTSTSPPGRPAGRCTG